MGGGELELALAGGQMNEYLNGSSPSMPKMTFFKSVYQKYHNFAQESISLPFDRNVQWTKSESVVTCEIKRYGQLLHKMCISLTLPSLQYITRNENNKRYIYQTKWAPYIGTAMIKTAELFIGGILIQTLTGEWIHTYYQTHSDSNERRAYQSLIGHVEDLVGTKEPSMDHTVTTPERTIHIPLPFLCDDTVSAIPLVALQLAKVEVRVTFRALQDVILMRRRNIMVPPPVISGVTMEDEILTASTQILEEAGMANISYQWQRTNSDTDLTLSNISGATSEEYTLTQADIGKRIAVSLSFTDTHNNIMSLNSDFTEIVSPAPGANGTPIESSSSP